MRSGFRRWAGIAEEGPAGRAERVCRGSGPGSGAQLQNIRGFSHQSSLADPLWAWRTGRIFTFLAQVTGEWFRKGHPSVLSNNVFLLLLIPMCCPEVPCTRECVCMRSSGPSASSLLCGGPSGSQCGQHWARDRCREGRGARREWSFPGALCPLWGGVPRSAGQH